MDILLWRNYVYVYGKATYGTVLIFLFEKIDASEGNKDWSSNACESFWFTKYIIFTDKPVGAELPLLGLVSEIFMMWIPGYLNIADHKEN